jgi:hypothetical protein
VYFVGFILFITENARSKKQNIYYLFLSHGKNGHARHPNITLYIYKAGRVYCTVRAKYLNTGRFIMLSMITNIYNKKTKWPTLMELFTATGKLKKLFLTIREVWCVHHEWHGTHPYDIQVLAAHVSIWVHCTHVDVLTLISTLRIYNPSGIWLWGFSNSLYVMGKA